MGWGLRGVNGKRSRRVRLRGAREGSGGVGQQEKTKRGLNRKKVVSWIPT